MLKKEMQEQEEKFQKLKEKNERTRAQIKARDERVAREKL